MQADFARTLSLLRQEKKISQRKAAEQLGVSQALLSHYENGVREPGLGFVLKASKFYSVSCDYLLGNSMNRDGLGLNPEVLVDMSEAKDNVLKGNVFAMINKKLLVNSVSLLMDILAKCEKKQLVQEISAYLSVAFYKAFRFVYECDKHKKDDMFPLPSCTFSEICDSHLKKSEAVLKDMANDQIELRLSHEEINAEYPALSASLFSLLHNTSEKISK